MRSLLDTNTVLYLLADRLAYPLPQGEYFLSVITEIELLSYPSLTEDEEQKIQAFLEDIVLIELSKDIRSATIDLRRKTGLKLPDAIIAATAIVINAKLLTNDRVFDRVSGLEVTALPLRKTEA
ncbi:MAG: type II toxin-antitoxin system VapC family toxin [Desulfobacterales bacterium]|nr:type II toxin-antitoxin system VapC family toxin [Desulfobacterales bacterium]